jgi:hypothetical protein
MRKNLEMVLLLCKPWEVCPENVDDHGSWTVQARVGLLFMHLSDS